MFALQMINEMENLQREMDQIFRGFGFRELLDAAPQHRVFRMHDAGEALEVEAPLPGLDVDKLDISVLNRRLSLKGEFVAENLPENVTWHRRERQAGSFEQVLTLPVAIDAEQVVAEYKNGLLKIRLPKAQSALPKKISVKAD